MASSARKKSPIIMVLYSVVDMTLRFTVLQYLWAEGLTWWMGQPQKVLTLVSNLLKSKHREDYREFDKQKAKKRNNFSSSETASIGRE